MEGISCFMWGLTSFALCSVWGEKKLVATAQVGKALKRQSLHESGLGKSTWTPGSYFHRKSSGGDFGQSSPTMLELDASSKAVVIDF